MSFLLLQFNNFFETGFFIESNEMGLKDLCPVYVGLVVHNPV